jgi:radical SAM superfamily enzyme YgiQ (UPF0313 family)
MEYDMPLYRPPSEARSLIFQVTLGCSWNKCLFCAMYKTKQFLVRPFEEVEKDIVEMSWRYPGTRKIFLADGDPLAAPTDYLIRVLEPAFPQARAYQFICGAHEPEGQDSG